MIAQAVRRRFAREDGVTLTEMLVVLAILVVVITSLTTLFVSASTSQVDQTNRVQAQQEARLALDALRREIHCARAITPEGVTTSSISLTLGPYCQNSGTKLTSALTIPAGGVLNATIGVADASAFPSGSVATPVKIDVGTSGGRIACEGAGTPTSFTLCDGGLASTHPAGTTVAGTTTITWCTKDATGSSTPAAATPPYSLWRYRGASCSGTGQKRADFLAETSVAPVVSAGQVFSYPVGGSGDRRMLHVALPVDTTPADTKQRFTLRDDIVLRNSPRSP